jgi:hypothetical protein
MAWGEKNKGNITFSIPPREEREVTGQFSFTGNLATVYLEAFAPDRDLPCFTFQLDL